MDKLALMVGRDEDSLKEVAKVRHVHFLPLEAVGWGGGGWMKLLYCVKNYFSASLQMKLCPMYKNYDVCG